MNPGQTFDRVYWEIRGRLLSGAWLPTQRIDLVGLADSLNASVTPVRDALYRLVGERLLELGVSEGFVVPGMTEPELCDRYAWSHMLMTLCLAAKPKKIEHSSFQAGDSMEGLAAQLFQAIAERAANIELMTAVNAISDRLSHARHVEARIGVATEDEGRALVRILQEGNTTALRSAIQHYHRHRIRMAGKIVYAMHRPD